MTIEAREKSEMAGDLEAVAEQLASSASICSVLPLTNGLLAVLLVLLGLPAADDRGPLDHLHHLAGRAARSKDFNQRQPSSGSGGSPCNITGGPLPAAKVAYFLTGTDNLTMTVPAVDHDALRKPVADAKAALDAGEAEAKQATEKAMVAGANATYMAALLPYRGACRKAGIAREFEGSRGRAVCDKVFFEVERVEKGVRVMIKGRPETEEVIPLAALKESAGKAAYSYTEKHLGTRKEVGNKCGTLANRLRAVLGCDAPGVWVAVHANPHAINGRKEDRQITAKNRSKVV